MRKAITHLANGAVRTALVLAALLAATPVLAQTSRFEGWTSAIVAGDWRDSRNQPIEAFDNAQRDLAAAFRQAGFAGAGMVSATLRPDAAQPVGARELLAAITDTARRADKGCLIYFTSHGSPEGIVFGPDLTVSPAMMANLVRNWCGARPTVVIMSACYSGVFVNALEGPNRMVLTAARRDRSSFGCGAGVAYPYFDGCVIDALAEVSDFIALAQSARACVAEREAVEGLTPASEPQLRIGGQMQLLLPTLRFNRASP